MAGTVGIAQADDTNTWFNLKPSDWTVDGSTRAWANTNATGSAESITEVTTNAEAMTTQKNTVADGRINLSTAGGFLVYKPGVATTNDSSAVVFVDLKVKFNAAKTLKVDGFDSLPGGRKARGAMSMYRHDDASLAFAGLDYAEDAYVWRELAGVTPATTDAEYEIRMVRTYSNETATVAYFVKDEGEYKPLDFGGKTEFAIPSANNYLSILGFRGSGAVAGATAQVVLKVEGLGIMLLPDWESPSGEVKVYKTIDEALADRPYGSAITVMKTIADGQTVTLKPGVMVTFAAGQQIGEGHLVVQIPGGVNYYDIVQKGGSCVLALNENAKPAVADFAADKKGITVGEGSEGFVDLNIANIKPNLYYGVKASGELTAVGAAEASGWVQADANGVLEGGLKAPKQGDDGFYTVVVTDDPRVMDKK